MIITLSPELTTRNNGVRNEIPKHVILKLPQVGRRQIHQFASESGMPNRSEVSLLSWLFESWEGGSPPELVVTLEDLVHGIETQSGAPPVLMVSFLNQMDPLSTSALEALSANPAAT